MKVTASNTVHSANKKARHNIHRFVFLNLLTLISSLIFSHPVFASHSVSIITDKNIQLVPIAGTTDVKPASVNVTTTCTAGYNLSIATTTANTLYLNGDDTNTTPSFTAVDSAYALNDINHNTDKWGYSMTGTASTAGAFNPLSTTPVFVKTTSTTSTEESTINDTFSIYYGATASNTTTSGTYRMANNGAIVYYLTVAESCADSAVVTFNENLDGEGGEGTDSTIGNFPTSSDNTTEGANIILSNKRPTRDGYKFKEWNTEANGTGSYYYAGESIPTGQDGLSGFVTLYAIWVEDCNSATICYDGNHADAGTMANQSGTAGNTVLLIPSNFSRAGYAFTGWNTEADGTGTQYGPNQNYSLPSGGITLFAQWLAPSGTLQTWSGANNLSVGDIIALRDNRDDEVYMVAKLADNNIWITENLRLVPNTANIKQQNTNNPTNAFLATYSSSATSNMCYSDSATCDDTVKFNTNNINRSLTASYNTNDNSSS